MSRRPKNSHLSDMDKLIKPQKKGLKYAAAKAKLGLKKSIDKSKRKKKQHIKKQAKNKINKTVNKKLSDNDQNYVESLVNEYSERHLKKIESAKKLLLTAGVSFFMLIIATVWIFSFKTQLKKQSRAVEGAGEVADIELLNKKFVETINSVTANIKNANKNELLYEVDKGGAKASSSENLANTLPLLQNENSTTTEKVKEQEKIINLKNELEAQINLK